VCFVGSLASDCDVLLMLDYVARACTSTLGVSSSVGGAHFMSRQHNVGGDHLSQLEIKSQLLDVT
jgi:hypothetical protein